MPIFKTIAAALCLTTPAFAQAIMKVPFGCAQVWDAWTYEHNNDIDSFDIALWDDRT